jgi:hypothetical protein
MLDPEELDFYKISKHELNLNTITDFLVISFANIASGNKDSLFLKMGKFLRAGGIHGVSKWLRGFIPPRNLLI